MPAPVTALLFAQTTAQPAPAKPNTASKTSETSAAAATAKSERRADDKESKQPADKASFQESFARETRKASAGVEKKSEAKAPSGAELQQEHGVEPLASPTGEMLVPPVAEIQPSQIPQGSVLQNLPQHFADASQSGGQKPAQNSLVNLSAVVAPGPHASLGEPLLLEDTVSDEGLLAKLSLSGSSAAKEVGITTATQQPFFSQMAQGMLNSNTFRSASMNRVGGLEAWQLLKGEGIAESGAALPTNGSSAAAVVHTSVNSLPMLGLGADGTAKFQLPVNVTFGQPQWAGAVAERSALLFSQNINNAELLLDPPELGRMTVQVQVHNDQASVTFTSANAGVREALDQSGQRLRELLAEQGIDLVNVDVSDQSPSHNGHSEDSPEAGSGGNLTDADEPAPLEVAVSLQSGVDQYV